MSNYVPVQYREVPMRQLSSSSRGWREINVSTGGIHNMLQDVKTSEQCGGYCFAEREDYRSNRFLYWRTCRDSIYLCELSMNLNLANNQLRISFDESPILSVEVTGNRLQVFILIATVTSIHRIVVRHPKVNSVNPDGGQESVLGSITKEQICDPASFYVISSDIGQALPAIAAAYRIEGEENDADAFYAISTVSNLYLFQLGSHGGVKITELKHNQLISRFFSGLTDAWRKRNANAPDQIVSLLFGELDGQSVLYAFYRNNITRIWATNGSCIGAECFVKHADQRVEGSQTIMVRKSHSLIGVFLAYSDCSEFNILRPEQDDSGNVALVKESIILAPNYDLIDFKLSDRGIWALWCNAEGEMQVLTYALSSESHNFWLPIPLESMDDKYGARLEKGTDLKHMYCQRIFHSGKFDNNVIAKTLSMFNRSFSYSNANISTAVLKRHVCSYIDGELQNERKLQNITDEEFIELSANLWEKFYLCCSQYNFEACQPIGMLILERMDVFCLVRKKLISLFRPCDELELAFLSENYPGNVALGAGDGKSLQQDVSVLVRMLKQIDKFVPEDEKVEIESCLFQLRSTKDVMETVAGSQCFVNQCNLTSVIQSIEDLPKAMAVLLQKLKLDYEPSVEASFYSNPKNLPFGGLLGIQLLTETVRQQIQLRYMVVRNLIILQHLLLNNFALNCNAMEIIRSKCIPDSEVFLQSYYVMNWIAETTVDYAAVRSKSLEGGEASSLVIGHEEAYGFEYLSLLHLFVATRGLKTCMSTEEAAAHGIADCERVFPVLLDVCNGLLRLIWPVAGDFTFGQWLMQGEMHIFIEQYVRLLNSWCEWNNCSRNFILAKSYLMNGENSKALDLFPQSAKGIFKEPYLINFTKPSDGSSVPPDEMLSIFYLKVIRLFEHYGAYDCINALAQIAIGTSVQSKQQAMFQSIDFSSHMELGHYEEAYHSLVYNCEQTRKKDCLRQLVWRLFQSKKFNILIDLPYYGLEMDFQNIMEMHARSVEISENSHYDFLYSYYILKGNMRKAALISYEKAMRCHLECNSLVFLKMRCEALLKCINALNLVAPDYAWIAKPTIFKESRESPDDQRTQIVVISLADVRKELMITEAVLEISKQLEDYKAVLDVDTDELIMILANGKLYATALKLAHALNRSVLPIYESLAIACVMCSLQDAADTWDWLHKNNLPETVIGADSTDTAWKFLKHCLTNETKDVDACHVAVIGQIIAKNAFPPQWLTDWCMSKTPTKLLQLYINYGRLEEAYDIAVKLIQAQLICKSSITAMHLNRFLLPVSLIDRLQYELRKEVKFQEQTNLLGQLIDCIAK